MKQWVFAVAVAMNIVTSPVRAETPQNAIASTAVPADAAAIERDGGKEESLVNEDATGAPAEVNAGAGEAAHAAEPRSSVVLELPILDLPDNHAGEVRAPSMQQTVAIGAAFYDASHAAIESATGHHRFWSKAAVALFDLATSAELVLPFGDAWVHEEFHRAVMSNRRIDSFNDVYKIELSPESIAVSHVRDEDLIRLKRDHPADMVRLGAAGIEGEQLLVQRLQKQHFFDGSTAWHVPLYWLVKTNSWAYLFSGADAEVDEDTDLSNATDGANVERRDFTGHDFNGWVYDLFRPNEPYAARGVHPSGVGIDRYRKTSHLTADERDYLDRQGYLALINFADASLFGLDSWSIKVGGRRVDVNVTASHFLTSFGYSVDANVFLRSGQHKLFVVLHRYANQERTFAGAEAELIDMALTFRGRSVTVTPRVALWSQPENQLFRDTRAATGGAIALRVDVPATRRFGAFVELESKTAGWMAGNVHLDANTSVRVGATMRLLMR